MQPQSHDHDQHDQTVDYSRKWYAMATVSMGVFLATIDGSIVNVALPTLVRELQATFPMVQWVVLSYMLTVTTLLLSVGRVADIVGKKPVYITGMVVFTISSALCGFSPTIHWLIGFRIVQAIGGAMIMALGPAIITEAFPQSERGRALGIIGSVVSVGIVVGPTAGGLLIDALSWHWIFFVNIPIGIAGVTMATRFLPATEPAGNQRFDYAGAILLFICLTSLLLGLTIGQDWGFTAPPILALFVVSVVFLAIFLSTELKVVQPMIDLTIFRYGLLGINLLMAVITFVSAQGVIFLIPFYLEDVLGYSTRQVGLLMAVIPISLGVTAPIAGSLSDRFGPRVISVIGLVVLFGGFLGLSTLSTETSTVGYLLRFLPIGAGMGIFQSPNNSAIMGAAPRQQLGVVSGLLAISRVLGQTIGVAVIGTVWAGFVFAHLGERLDAGATAAPIVDQVAGLQSTALVTLGLISVGLVLGIWGVVQERLRDKPVAQT